MNFAQSFTSSGGRKAKYLLSGLMKCGECGSNFIVNDRFAYTCSAFKTGGADACSNGISVNRKVAESVILEQLQNHLLTEKNIEKMRREWDRQYKALIQAQANRDTSKAIKAELAELDRKRKNLVSFIAEHGGDEGVKAELDRLDSRRDELLANLHPESNGNYAH